jgi:hypothetical protein
MVALSLITRRVDAAVFALTANALVDPSEITPVTETEARSGEMLMPYRP